MIIYSGTKLDFAKDTITGVIDEKLERSILEKMGRHTGESEMRSWQNSLHRMNEILYDPEIPDNAGIAIEYNIPYTSKRVDMIISGRTEKNNSSAVVIELKQWSSIEKVSGKDGIVKTAVGGGIHEVTHPSYQAWSYVQTIEDFNAEIQDDGTVLYPCAFLHNYVVKGSDDPLFDNIYSEYLEMAPAFTKHDALKLREFIKRYIKFGDKGETIFKIDGGRLRPSKSLQDSLSSMLRGNPEFVMIDEQKVAYEAVAKAIGDVNGRKKQTIIIEGGPGTGKSVLAINLLVNSTAKELVCSYVTKNSAPRNVYAEKLKGTMKNNRIKALFKSSGSFTDTPSDIFDVLLVDEAHRLNEKSGMFSNLGENQVKEIINASKVSVFFIDEHQRVIVKDIGTKGEIRKWAKALSSEIIEKDLPSQFRCNGSDGYLAWLDDILYNGGTANFDSADNPDYDFRVFDDPCELRKVIEEKNKINNKSRLVAGYCWNWISEGKNDPNVFDITIPGTDFKMSWNLGNSSTWAIDEDSVEEAGCIHTCQGLEFDYIGVIIGDDLFYKDGLVCTDRKKRAKTDQSLKGLTKKYPDTEKAEEVADEIIRNTYRTLMSRGLKGCYVYCTDKDMNMYLLNKSLSFKKQ
jgi:DUF2075 family protein